MQENNMSVFGTVIRNEEIADFMRLLNLAREIFKQELTVVEIMPGGLTNKNFRAVTEDGTQIAIRLAGQGTANYINRPGEKHNAGEIAGLGIAPEIYYYDPKTGSQIVEYIDAPTMHPVDFQTRDEVLVKAGAVMRRYHDSGLEFKTSFDPVAKIDEYKAILDEHNYGKRYEGWERMVEALECIRAAYATGRGRITVRARTEFEEFGNNRTRIIVTEIPYQVNKRMLIKNMADQVEDKRLEGISDIRDESDRNGMRVVIELKRDANPQVVLNRLFAQTQLQTTFAINMLALVQSGGQPQPKILSLRHILDEYIAFQEEVIVRRTRYDLRKAQERAHLLEGLLIAEDNIDAVIQTIRESYDDAKENLMNRFGLSDVQAQAILDMQLKRLQGLEKEKLQNEYKELEARIAYFNELLSSEEKIRGVLKDELTAIRDRYGDDRVTEIQDVEDEIDIEDLIEEEECVFTLTAGGYIKRTAASTYKAQRRGGKGITAMSTKEEDYVDTVFTASTHDFILFFTNKGRVHRKKGYQIPEAGRTARGTNLVNVLPIEQDEKVTAMIHLREFPEDRYLVMVTRSGTVKRIQLSSIYTARKAGIRCITLDEGDELICVRETDGDQAILIVTHDGMAICFKETDVRCMGRDAAGVRGINLRPGDYVVGAARAKRDHQVLMITENGYGKRTDMDEYIRADGPQKRGGFGLKGYNITEKTGPVVGVKVVSDGDDVLVINDAGVIIRMAAAGISTYGRTAQGVKIMNLEEGVKVISFARTDHEEEEEAAEGETPAGGPEQA